MTTFAELKRGDAIGEHFPSDGRLREVAWDLSLCLEDWVEGRGCELLQFEDGGAKRFIYGRHAQAHERVPYVVTKRRER